MSIVWVLDGRKCCW